jgi:HEAT repeat protein
MDAEKEQDRTIAFQTLESIEKFESPEQSFAQLAFLLAQPYQWFRIRAAELLGKIKNDSVVSLLAVALNDRCEYVGAAAAESLVKIGTSQALDILRRSFLEDEVKRPHYLANAIAQFGREGFEILLRCTASESPTLRYYAAKGLGATGFEEAISKLEQMAEFDLEETPFNSTVAAGARQGLKTLRRIQAHSG